MWDSSFWGALTPKFYVALTGTSSLISGLILIFEWWYFRKYGTSFIEQVSLSHPSPQLNDGATSVASTEGVAASGSEAEGGASEDEGEGLVRRNPMALLRGAEYARLWTAARRAPLTSYDMNLTAQEHRARFGRVGDGPVEEALGRAWREREPSARAAAAREALRLAPDCSAALLLLAEEDAPTVLEAERVLQSARRAAAASLRSGRGDSASRARDEAVLLHARRRAAACCRRMGRLRDAARLLRDEQAHEALLEVLLEQRAYPEARAALARLERRSGASSACVAYTRALLELRSSSAAAEASLAAALARNPHAAAYLLERRALALPPEHVVRGGRSEGLAYAFFHLRHWRACPGALRRLEAAWRARGEATPPLSAPDRALLPGAALAGRGAPALVPLAALLCALTALTALLAHRWPARARAAALRLDPRRLLALLSRSDEDSDSGSLGPVQQEA